MLKNRKKQKNISADDILTKLDGSDIDLLSTDNEYENEDIEYVPYPNKSSSNFELGFSDTDEPDTIPSTSSSSLAKQLKEKKKKSLSATTLRSATALRSTVELTLRSQLKKTFVSVAGLTMEL